MYPCFGRPNIYLTSLDIHGQLVKTAVAEASWEKPSLLALSGSSDVFPARLQVLGSCWDCRGGPRVPWWALGAAH